MGALDSGIGRRVRPEEPGVGSNRFLWPADDHRPRGDGGRRVLRPIPAALAERRAGGSDPVAVDRSRAAAVVAQSAHTRCARAKSRAVYHFWRAHPVETMFYPLEALQVERVPASDVLHVYKPIRAGQFRGQPWLTTVLAKLYELEQYTDAEIVRKKISAMITGFIKQVSPDNPVMAPDQTSTGQSQADPGTQISKLEPGTFPVLGFGEEGQFAVVKFSGDDKAFVRACLQAFASGAGLAEYQISGDLSGINYSSIRAGLLEFRRKCEQFQYSVFIYQVCHPIYRRWLREAMLAMVFGVELLNAYDKDPEPFEAAQWVTPGWPWVDPEKDMKAAERAIRDGLSTRSIECAAQGYDAAVIDQEQAADNTRADRLGLSYDSDGRKILTGRNAGLTEGEVANEAASGKVEVQ